MENPIANPSQHVDRLEAHQVHVGPEQDATPIEAQRRFSRRHFVGGSATLGIGALALTALAGPRFAAPTVSAATGTPWSKKYGTAAADVVIDSNVILDVSARVRSLKITKTGRLDFANGTSVTLTSLGNVEVAGVLAMQPSSAAVVHRLHFEGVVESKFVGGGMSVLASDVGLWVVGTGKLLATGADRQSWTRASASLAKGTKTITVDDPRGWRVGDTITITPTGAPSPDNGRFHQSSDSSHEYDDAVITAISGRTLTLDRALTHSHPMVSFKQWDGAARSYGAEVLNLTRNVVISGTKTGRAHVEFLHCSYPQSISNVQFDQLGARKAAVSNPKRTEGVVGRYPFHMHHCGNGSRGTVLKNCLVTRSGNRAYVPHESHGVTLDGCVAHDVHGTAYWWDQPGRHNPTGEKPVTHDSLWTRCVASKVYAPQNSEDGYRLAGFNLSDGNHGSNRLINSVAVGVTSDRVTMSSGANSGFHWTEHGQAIWQFKGNLAHNIAGDGILGWQNDEEVHVISDFTAYHCGAHGIEHGAYSNMYSYDRLTLIGNRCSGISIHAVTRRTNSVRRRWTDKGLAAPVLEFENVFIDGRGISKDGIRGLSHKFAANSNGPTVLKNVVVTGVTRAGFYESKGKNANIYSLTNFRVSGVKPVAFEAGAPANTVVKITNLNGDGKTTVVKP